MRRRFEPAGGGEGRRPPRRRRRRADDRGARLVRRARVHDHAGLSAGAAPGAAACPPGSARRAPRRACSSSASAGPRRARGCCRASRAREWGGVVLEPGNGESPQQVADARRPDPRAAADAGHEVPLFAASQLGGDLDAVPVGAPLQSQLRDAATARATALAVAKALHPLGIRMVLGPDADIGFAGGPWDGVAYSDDPAAVAAMSTAAVAGYKDGEVAAGARALPRRGRGVRRPGGGGRDRRPLAGRPGGPRLQAVPGAGEPRAGHPAVVGDLRRLRRRHARDAAARRRRAPARRVAVRRRDRLRRPRRRVAGRRRAGEPAGRGRAEGGRRPAVGAGRRRRPGRRVARGDAGDARPATCRRRASPRPWRAWTRCGRSTACAERVNGDNGR